MDGMRNIFSLAVCLLGSYQLPIDMTRYQRLFKYDWRKIFVKTVFVFSAVWSMTNNHHLRSRVRSIEMPRKMRERDLFAESGIDNE